MPEIEWFMSSRNVVFCFAFGNKTSVVRITIRVRDRVRVRVRVRVKQDICSEDND